MFKPCYPSMSILFLLCKIFANARQIKMNVKVNTIMRLHGSSTVNVNI